MYTIRFTLLKRLWLYPLAHISMCIFPNNWAINYIRCARPDYMR